jgi:hypothetical protein
MDDDRREIDTSAHSVVIVPLVALVPLVVSFFNSRVSCAPFAAK